MRQQAFQFHKGTIKTKEYKTTFRYFTVFQFHKGTIKTGYGERISGRLLISIP